MPSEQQSIGKDEAELASHRIWDKVERRLWSRARLILLFVVIGIAVIVLLGVPLIRNVIEQRVLEQARAIIAEQVVSQQMNAAAMGEELRADTRSVRDELIEGRIQMETRLRLLLAKAEALEATFLDFDKEAQELEDIKTSIHLIQQRLKNEHERLHNLRADYARDLKTFEQTSNRMIENAPQVISSELRRVENIVDRELDELRLTIADHIAGKPALFSTYFATEERLGQITGVNFGGKPGRVFMRVRAFAEGGSDPKAESDSIVLPPTFWGDMKIEMRLSARALEQIAEAEEGVSAAAGESITLRHGFMVQAADGRMSQWSGRRVDSLIPPERLSAAVEDENP